MVWRLRRVDSFEDIKRAGLFYGVSVLQVLASQAIVFSSRIAGVVSATGPEANEHTTKHVQGASETWFEAAAHVNSVDFFISHTWSADRWLKYLALCMQLNLGTAVCASVATWIATAGCLVVSAGGLTALGGGRLLLPELVFFPTAVFYLTFFFGHELTSRFQQLPIVWLDKLCVHQIDEDLKAQQVRAMPVFVARSWEMLVLWDDTYFERLWCNLELATFAKYGSADRIRILPLWLAPWLLSSMLLDLASATIFELLEIAIPNWSMAFVQVCIDFFEEVFHLGENSPAGLVLACTTIWSVSGVCYMPTTLAGFVAFRQKICSHQLMLEQMSSFDVRAAKCTFESDRDVVELQIQDLFWEGKRATEVGATEAEMDDEGLDNLWNTVVGGASSLPEPPGSLRGAASRGLQDARSLQKAAGEPASGEPASGEPASGERPRSLPPGSLSGASGERPDHVSSEEEEEVVEDGLVFDGQTYRTRSMKTIRALDSFSAYIRGPLHDAVLNTIGNETHVPYHLCIVAFLPMNFYSLVNILGCDNGPCERSAKEAGYPTVTTYMVTQATAWTLCLLLTFPLTHPVLLRLIRLVMSVTDGNLQLFLAVLCCPLAYAYTYVCGGIIWGLLMVNAETQSFHWLAALIVYLALLVLQAVFFFRRSGHQSHHASSRVAKRQVDEWAETTRPFLSAEDNL